MAIIQDEGSYFIISVHDGYDSDGKEIIHTTTFSPNASLSKEEQFMAVQRMAASYERQLKEDKAHEIKNISLSDFYQKWLNNYALIHLQDTTVEWYRTIIEKKILPFLGNFKLKELTPFKIQEFYNSLSRKGAKSDGDAYSVKSVKDYHAALSSLLNKAVEWDFLDVNPAKKAHVPKKNTVPEEKISLTPEQAKIFLDALDKTYTSEYKGHTRNLNNKKYTVNSYSESRTVPTQIKLLFNMALYSGMRKGELLALTWNDINYKKRTVTINKSAAPVAHSVTVKSTKNISSNRIITVPQSVMDLLAVWQKEQAEIRQKLGDKWKGNNNIFIQANGKIMHPSTPYHTLKDFIEKYNNSVDDVELKLPDIRFHDLRHTCATLLISANVDVKTVSARLGHTQTSTTLNIYAHRIDKLDVVASDTLENMLSRDLNESDDSE